MLLLSLGPFSEIYFECNLLFKDNYYHNSSLKQIMERKRSCIT